MINPKIGILEILMPLYPVLLVYIFKSVDVAKYEFTSTEAISFAPADSLLNNSYAEPLYPVVQWAAAPQNLYFAPDTVQSRSTASQICGKLGINSSLATWFQDGDALLKAGRIKNPEQDIPAEPRAGLILNPEENKFTLVHINDEYLNYYTNGVIAATDKKRARANAESIFVYNGFAVLQAAANEVMSDIPDNLLQTVKMESFDIPQTAEVQNGLKIILVLGFGSLYFMNLMNTLTSLGRDVEMGIKEALSLKGMQSAPYFLAKFFGDMFTIFVATLIAVPVSFGLGLFENANALLVFYILFLFGLGQTTFCLCVAISFGKSVKSKNLMMVGFMLFSVIQGLYFVVEFLMIEKDALPFFVQLTMFLFVIPFLTCSGASPTWIFWEARATSKAPKTSIWQAVSSFWSSTAFSSF